MEHSRWGEGKQTLSNNALQLITSQSIQHQLLFPLLVQRPPLCPHFVGNRQYAVGTYNGQLVVYYARELLDRMVGGLSALFEGIRLVSNISSSKDMHDEGTVIDIVYSSKALELVLNRKVAPDEAEVKTWRHYDRKMPYAR